MESIKILNNSWAFVPQMRVDEIASCCAYEVKEMVEDEVKKTTKHAWLTRPGGVWIPLGIVPSLPADIPIMDLKDSVSMGDDSLFVGELRDYQMEMLENLCRVKRGILIASPNAGKTHVSAALISRLPKPVLVIVYRKEAMLQTIKVYENILQSAIGKWNATEKKLGDIVVALAPTLVARRGKLSTVRDLLGFKSLIVIECHHIGNTYLFYVIQQMVNASYRYGMSATPLLRTDGTNIFTIGALGDVVHQTLHNELAGTYSAPCIGITFNIGCLSQLNPKDNNWGMLSWKGLYCNRLRNQLIREVVRVCVKQGLTTLVFVERLKHGAFLSRLLGVPFIHGKSSNREQIFENFAPGNAMVCTKIFEEEMDWAFIDVVVNAAGGRSPIKAVQRAGRLLRIKDVSYMIDFVDVGHPILRFHSQARESYLQRERILGRVERFETVQQLEDLLGSRVKFKEVGIERS